MITIRDVENHIRHCKKLQKRYNWLGFVENQDLSPEVEALFSVGNGWWDWVKGNQKLWALEASINE